MTYGHCGPSFTATWYDDGLYAQVLSVEDGERIARFEGARPTGWTIRHPTLPAEGYLATAVKHSSAGVSGQREAAWVGLESRQTVTYLVVHRDAALSESAVRAEFDALLDATLLDPPAHAEKWFRALWASETARSQVYWNETDTTIWIDGETEASANWTLDVAFAEAQAQGGTFDRGQKTAHSFASASWRFQFGFHERGFDFRTTDGLHSLRVNSLGEASWEFPEGDRGAGEMQTMIRTTFRQAGLPEPEFEGWTTSAIVC
jgi:hypothetical protein